MKTYLLTYLLINIVGISFSTNYDYLANFCSKQKSKLIASREARRKGRKT